MTTTAEAYRALNILDPIIQYGSHFYQYQHVEIDDIFLFTFSDGTQIAISDYDDKEYSDLRIGIPQDDVVNFYMYYANSGASFTIYQVSNSTLGAPIYTFSNSTDLLPSCFQITYNASLGQLDVYFDGNGSTINTGTGAYDSFSGVKVLDATPVCFLRGTRILTLHGEVAIEDLAPGDRVVTRCGGVQPIRWIGTQSFDSRLAGRAHLPIRIAAHAMGDGQPHTDLLVSPGHSILLDNVLVHADALVNDVTITRDGMTGKIEYYHLDLPQHDCVLANGVWAETYFEDHNRNQFHNAADFYARFPFHLAHRQETCLPVVASANPHAAALHALLAPKLPASMLSPNADIHLLIDGCRVALEKTAEHTWQATIPAGARRLFLRSRATRPSMVSASTDRRALGVLLWAIDIVTASGVVTVPIDHPWLSRGWHDVERDGANLWRWTDGDAEIPMRLLGDAVAPVCLVLRAFQLPLNYTGGPSQQAAAAARPRLASTDAGDDSPWQGFGPVVHSAR